VADRILRPRGVGPREVTESNSPLSVCVGARVGLGNVARRRIKVRDTLGGVGIGD